MTVREPFITGSGLMACAACCQAGPQFISNRLHHRANELYFVIARNLVADVLEPLASQSKCKRPLR